MVFSALGLRSSTNISIGTTPTKPTTPELAAPEPAALKPTDPEPAAPNPTAPERPQKPPIGLYQPSEPTQVVRFQDGMALVPVFLATIHSVLLIK